MQCERVADLEKIQNKCKFVHRAFILKNIKYAVWAPYYHDIHACEEYM